MALPAAVLVLVPGARAVAVAKALLAAGCEPVEASSARRARGAVVAADGDSVALGLSMGIPVLSDGWPAHASEALRSLAVSSGGRLHLLDERRLHPGAAALREIVRTGELGRVCGLRVVRECPGKAARLLLAEALTSVHKVLGEIPPARAACDESEGAHALLALLGSSPWASLWASSRCPGPADAVELRCEAGQAALRSPGAGAIEVFRWECPRPVEIRELQVSHPLEAAMAEFAEHLDDGPPPSGSLRDAALVAAAVEDCMRLATHRSA